MEHEEDIILLLQEDIIKLLDEKLTPIFKHLTNIQLMLGDITNELSLTDEIIDKLNDNLDNIDKKIDDIIK